MIEFLPATRIDNTLSLLQSCGIGAVNDIGRHAVTIILGKASYGYFVAHFKANDTYEGHKFKHMAQAMKTYKDLIKKERA